LVFRIVKTKFASCNIADGFFAKEKPLKTIVHPESYDDRGQVAGWRMTGQLRIERAGECGLAWPNAGRGGVIW